MENNEVANSNVTLELQRIVQKIDKLEKMINPNSKKSLILWEEDTSFKALISAIVNYATTCNTDEFPVELLDKLKAMKTDAETQITDGEAKIAELNAQAKENTQLSEILSSAYVSAMAGTPETEYAEKITGDVLSPMKEHLDTIATCLPDSDEYVKAEKTIKSKITNLENSVHITIDLERTTSKAGALEYIKTEITPAVERLQAEYDAKYATVDTVTETDEEIITALAIRKTFSEKVYDAIVKPFASLFKRKSKVK
ncbi:MAG: hypothetical protein IKK43_04980 [Clostridia bacterium]|nr:hypothetical protein [Clostridia bacterium]